MRTLTGGHETGVREESDGRIFIRVIRARPAEFLNSSDCAARARFRGRRNKQPTLTTARNNAQKSAGYGVRSLLVRVHPLYARRPHKKHIIYRGGHCNGTTTLRSGSVWWRLIL